MFGLAMGVASKNESGSVCGVLAGGVTGDAQADPEITLKMAT